jgi:hypothetical protein
VSPCRITDVSASGMALTLVNQHQYDPGEAVLIEVERVGTTPVMFLLHGLVRHVDQRDEQGLRIGLSLEVENLCEQRILRALTTG